MAITNDPTQVSSFSELNQRTDKLNSMYDSLQGKMATVVDPMLAGKIPEDVQAQIRQVASENAGIKGLGLGQAGRALVARDLGLTSLQIQAQGLQAAQPLLTTLNQSQQLNEAALQGRYGLLSDTLKNYHTIQGQMLMNNTATTSVSADFGDFMKKLRATLVE